MSAEYVPDRASADDRPCNAEIGQDKMASDSKYELFGEFKRDWGVGSTWVVSFGLRTCFLARSYLRSSIHGHGLGSVRDRW